MAAIANHSSTVYIAVVFFSQALWRSRSVLKSIFTLSASVAVNRQSSGSTWTQRPRNLTTDCSRIGRRFQGPIQVFAEKLKRAFTVDAVAALKEFDFGSVRQAQLRI